MIMTVCYTKRIRKDSTASMMTSDWGRWKGPPSASEWTFGSAGRSTQCKAEVEDVKWACVRNVKMKLGQRSIQGQG